jgi:hypothetical protein
MEQRQVKEANASDLAEGFVRNPARRALTERWKKWIPQVDANGRKINMNLHNQWCLAQLYENQLSELKTFKEKHMIGEDTTTVNTAPFIKYTFPLLRRVWPSLIAPEIVSIQPMTAPVGAIFYFELKYGQNKGTVVQGQRLVKDFNRDYSSQYIDGETVATGDGATTTFNYTLEWTPVIPNTVTIQAGAVQGADDGAGNIVGTGIAGGSTVNYTTGAVHVVFSAAPAVGVAVLALYQYNAEGNAEVPDVYIDVALVAVTAKSRKLKALWSSEAADDLKALHGVDAEQELVAGLGSELALEIDREIITDIQNGNTGAQASYDLAVPSGTKELDQIRGLITPLTLIANQIGKNTLRGPANWAVMSYDLAAYVEQLSTDGFFRPVFAGNTDAFNPAEQPQTWGMMKMGTIQTRYVCYKDPYLTPNEMVIGYKGNSFVDAAYVWAPYVPLQVTATFLDPNDFRFRKGMRTRYAKLLARSEFYGLLSFTNLTTITPGAFGPGVTAY